MASMHGAHVLTVESGTTAQFPSVGTEILSSIVHLLGVSILSYLLALKVDHAALASFQFSRFSIARLLVIGNVLDSWAFIFSTGVLVHGAGMELSSTVCLLGILNCIIFYASSKMLVYIFLVEKVHVVWGGRQSRLRSKVYLGCVFVLFVYVGVAIFLFFGHISYFRGDGSCVIGLTRAASLTLLIYDLCVNILLTSLFVWPLLDNQFTPSIRKVAVRTLWAAAIALTTSCVNMLVLTIMHGQQLAWVCLASCGTDVVVNAAVLCWITSGASESATEHSHDPSGPDSKTHNGGAPAVVFYNHSAPTSPTSPQYPHRSEQRSRSRSKLSRILGSGTWGGRFGGSGSGGVGGGSSGGETGVELAVAAARGIGMGPGTRSADSAAAMERKAAVFEAPAARRGKTSVRRPPRGAGVGVTSEVQIVVTTELDILADSASEEDVTRPHSPEKPRTGATPDGW